jgi:hypothetical protein
LPPNSDWVGDGSFGALISGIMIAYAKDDT